MSEEKKKQEKDSEEDIGEDTEEEAEEELESEEETEEETSSHDDEQQVGEEVTKASNKPLLVIIAILVAIIAGFILAGSLTGNTQDSGPEVNYKKYNGFQMTNISGMWATQIQLPGSQNVHAIEMRESPWAVEHIPVEEGVLEETLNSSRIYLTIAPDMSSMGVVAMIEVGRITGNKYDLFNIPTEGALTKPGRGAPYVTCENATENTRVVHFQLADATRVRNNGEGCVLVEGTNESQLVKAADRLTYDLMGVIP